MTKAQDPSENEVLAILSTAKGLAQRYRSLTGKPLGITGEVAEYEASIHLGVKLTPARQAGYDGELNGTKYQIKGRCMLRAASPVNASGGSTSRKNSTRCYWFFSTRTSMPLRSTRRSAIP